ncbi:MAG: hypothetical protein B5766_00635 [Candidatus Lumbricidophila eiseniae]|uniref:Uncharacterized protein n=1 Tax=Candidatus Lumbricidiphila eiseniae TaxID=1969409 RepID=A0A2A6FU95_9MICO|nr:MAG: hypothetical protein B5766_00635 [Candidatus Lumbricidophila eiseniae]
MGRTTILCRLAIIIHCPVGLRVLSARRSSWVRVALKVRLRYIENVVPVVVGEDCAVVVGRGVLSAAVAV